MKLKTILLPALAFFAITACAPEPTPDDLINDGQIRTAEKEDSATLAPVFQTRRAKLDDPVTVQVSSKYDGPTSWEDSKDITYTLAQPIPAGSIIKIKAPRFVESGLFSVWVLDSDEVKDQLLMNTTTSWDTENFRLRNDAYYLQVDTDGSQKWTIDIVSTP